MTALQRRLSALFPQLTPATRALFEDVFRDGEIGRLDVGAPHPAPATEPAPGT